MTDATLLVRTNRPEEFLACLPTLAGMPLAQCIVVVPFEGKRATSAMCTRLPGGVVPTDIPAFASMLVGMVSRAAWCDSVLLAVYCDEPFAEASPAWSTFLRAVSLRFDDAGFRDKGRFIIAGDGWGDDDEPPGGPARDLSELVDPAHPAPERDLEVFPTPDRERLRRVSTAVSDLLHFQDEETAFGSFRPVEPPEPVALLEEALAGDPAELPVSILAQLVSVIHAEGDVDRTVLQIAFGTKVGAESWRRTLETRVVAAEAGLDPDAYLQREDEAGRLSAADSRFARLMVGDTSETPSRKRLHAGVALMTHLVAHAPSVDRPALLCVLAWLLWSVGRASLAADALAASARIHPSHGMTGVLSAVMRAYPLPQWVYERPGPTNRAERRRRARAGR